MEESKEDLGNIENIDNSQFAANETTLKLRVEDVVISMLDESDLVGLFEKGLYNSSEDTINGFYNYLRTQEPFCKWDDSIQLLFDLTKGLLSLTNEKYLPYYVTKKICYCCFCLGWICLTKIIITRQSDENLINDINDKLSLHLQTTDYLYNYEEFVIMNIVAHSYLKVSDLLLDSGIDPELYFNLKDRMRELLELTYSKINNIKWSVVDKSLNKFDIKNFQNNEQILRKINDILRSSLSQLKNIILRQNQYKQELSERKQELLEEISLHKKLIRKLKIQPLLQKLNNLKNGHIQKRYKIGGSIDNDSSTNEPYSIDKNHKIQYDKIYDILTENNIDTTLEEVKYCIDYADFRKLFIDNNKSVIKILVNSLKNHYATDWYKLVCKRCGKSTNDFTKITSKEKKERLNKQFCGCIINIK